jgi:hypothetical protein
LKPDEKPSDERFVDWVTTIAQAKANLPRMQEISEVIMSEHSIGAKTLKSYFDSLVEAGFTQEQALTITIEHGWMGK